MFQWPVVSSTWSAFTWQGMRNTRNYISYRQGCAPLYAPRPDSLNHWIFSFYLSQKALGATVIEILNPGTQSNNVLSIDLRQKDLDVDHFSSMMAWKYQPCHGPLGQFKARVSSNRSEQVIILDGKSSPCMFSLNCPVLMPCLVSIKLFANGYTECPKTYWPIVLSQFTSFADLQVSIDKQFAPRRDHYLLSLLP
jgi:hypothetical protein